MSVSATPSRVAALSNVPDYSADTGIPPPLDGSLTELFTIAYNGDRDELDRFHGYGEAHFRGGRVYAGDFEHGVFHGVGRLQWADGAVYKGDFVNGRMEGDGVLQWPDGSEYRGAVHHGQRHGAGWFRDGPTGSEYEGSWENGLRHGEGTLRYGSGSSPQGEYRGGWRHGCRHGRGTLSFPSGSVYEGGFFDDMKKGVGEMRWRPNGEQYIGEWDNDSPEGYGVFTWWGAAGDSSSSSQHRSAPPPPPTRKDISAARTRSPLGRTPASATRSQSLHEGIGRGAAPSSSSSSSSLRRRPAMQVDTDSASRGGRGSFRGGTGAGTPASRRSGRTGTTGAAAAAAGHRRRGGAGSNGAQATVLRNCAKRTRRGQVQMRYEGYLRAGVPHGWGTMHYEDGSRFSGWWVRGEKHGEGAYVASDGRVQHGLFSEDKPIALPPSDSSAPRAGLSIRAVEAQRHLRLHVGDVLAAVPAQRPPLLDRKWQDPWHAWIQQQQVEVERIVTRWGTELRSIYDYYSHRGGISLPTDDQPSVAGSADAAAIWPYGAGRLPCVGIQEGVYTLSLGQLWEFVRDCGLLRPPVTIARIDRLLKRSRTLLASLAMEPLPPSVHESARATLQEAKSSDDESNETEGDRHQFCTRVAGDAMGAPHDPDMPVLFREFVEVLVRLAAAEYDGRRAPEVPLREPELTDREKRMMEAAAASAGSFGGEHSEPASPSGKSRPAGTGFQAARASRRNTGVASHAARPSMTPSVAGSVAARTMTMAGSQPGTMASKGTMATQRVAASGMGKAQFIGTQDMPPPLTWDGQLSLPPQPSPLTSVYGLPWRLEMLLWTFVRPNARQARPQPGVRGMLSKPEVNRVWRKHDGFLRRLFVAYAHWDDTEGVEPGVGEARRAVRQIVRVSVPELTMEQLDDGGRPLVGDIPAQDGTENEQPKTASVPQDSATVTGSKVGPSVPPLALPQASVPLSGHLPSSLPAAPPARPDQQDKTSGTDNDPQQRQSRRSGNRASGTGRCRALLKAPQRAVDRRLVGSVLSGREFAALLADFDFLGHDFGLRNVARIVRETVYEDSDDSEDSDSESNEQLPSQASQQPSLESPSLLSPAVPVGQDDVDLRGFSTNEPHPSKDDGPHTAQVIVEHSTATSTAMAMEGALGGAAPKNRRRRDALADLGIEMVYSEFREALARTMEALYGRVESRRRAREEYDAQWNTWVEEAEACARDTAERARKQLAQSAAATSSVTAAFPRAKGKKGEKPKKGDTSARKKGDVSARKKGDTSARRGSVPHKGEGGIETPRVDLERLAREHPRPARIPPLLGVRPSSSAEQHHGDDNAAKATDEEVDKGGVGTSSGDNGNEQDEQERVSRTGAGSSAQSGSSALRQTLPEFAKRLDFFVAHTLQDTIGRV